MHYLSKLLVDDSKLEVVAYDMFIKGHNKTRGLQEHSFVEDHNMSYTETIIKV